MGFSKSELQPTESFHYIQGYLVWTMQKKRGTLCFGTLELHTCKFGYSVQTYIVSAIFQL